MKSKETKIKNIAVNPPYLIAFLIIIAIGAFCHTIIPSNWQYLFGFITACFINGIFEVFEEELEEILKEEEKL